jgi:hypothetical protein
MFFAEQHRRTRRDAVGSSSIYAATQAEESADYA